MASTYPTGRDYSDAIQNIRHAFNDTELKGGTPELNPMGLPKPISGQYASVFKVVGASGRRWAVKCFTTPVNERERRYRTISDALRRMARPWQVAFEYQAEGILVRGMWYPIVKMEWIDATGLVPWLTQNLFDSARIAHVASQFLSIVSDLENAGVSHGDLQHGNVLIGSGGKVRLIDYDGMFVPGLESVGANERGHRNYQHPKRANEFGPGLDRFAAWVIAGSLVALAIDPGLWYGLHNDGDEKLLFGDVDYGDVTASPALRALRATGDANLVALSERIEHVLRQDLSKIPMLDAQQLPLKNVTIGQAWWAIAPAAAPDAPTATSSSTPQWMLDAGFATTGRVIQSGAVGPSVGGAHLGGWISTHLPPRPSTTFGGDTRPARTAAMTVGSAAVLLAGAGVVTGVAAALVFAPIVLLVGLLLSFQLGWRHCPERAGLVSARQQARRKARARDASKRRLEPLEGEGRALDAREAAALSEIATRRQALQTTDGQQRAALDQKLAGDVARIQIERGKANELAGASRKTALDALQQAHLNYALAQATVRAAQIDGISDSLKAALERHGIRNAFDFTGVTLSRYASSRYSNSSVAHFHLRSGGTVRVPGIGEVKSQRLDRWRQGLETAARRSQPSTLAKPQEDEIVRQLQAKLQSLATEEAVLRRNHAAARDSLTATTKHSTSLIDQEMSDSRATFGGERAALHQRIVHARTEASRADFEMAKAELKLESYAGISFNGYVRYVITGRT
jgi:hypothetical protein